MIDGSESNKTSENLQGNGVDGPVGSKQSEMAEIEPAVDYASVQDDSKETASIRENEGRIRDDSYQGAKDEGHQTDHHQNDFDEPIKCQDYQERVDMTKTALLMELKEELREADEVFEGVERSMRISLKLGEAQQRLLETPNSRREHRRSKQNNEPRTRLERKLTIRNHE